MRSGGGWHAIRYFMGKMHRSGYWKTWKALNSKNACKTCALGMGGQKGGMVNESGSWPEVCKKSIQALAADLQGAIKPEFWSTYSIEQLKKFTPRELENCGRLSQPVVLEKDAQYYRPIEWEEAFERIDARLKALSADETFWYFSGRSSNEAGFLLQMFARIYGTNNVNNCSYYCHQASGVGLQSSVGSGTATIVLEDFEKADLVFVIGGNPSSNHPRMMTELKNVRRRGGDVIVINPVREMGMLNFSVPSDPRSLLFGSKIATQYVQLDIGGDLALLTGIAKRILEMSAHDQSFCKSYCNDFDAWRSHVESIDWNEIVAKSGATKEDIDEIADRYAKSKNAIFSWTMGITHHHHGVQNVQAIANLAMLRGMLGKPHAGLMPIRGHSNVQGIGSVGVTPKLKDEIFSRLQSHFDVKLPETDGLDTLACMNQAHDRQLKFGFCLGGNLYGSNPDANYAAAAMQNLETVVYMNTTLNTGHAHGCGEETIILPVLARDEEPEPTTQESMFNFVRLSDGGKPRFDGARSEVNIISEMACRYFDESSSAIDWNEMRSTGNIRSAIAKIVPGYDAIEDIESTKKEFQVEGRTYHEPKFGTPDQKAQFHQHDLPELPGGENQFRMMSVRSEGQFNTVVYDDGDIYRKQKHRDVVLMHPDDVARIGLQHDSIVDVSNETGTMKRLTLRAYDQIKAGNVLMYYPEVNVLIPKSVDPKSRTPAFKGVPVSIERSREN